MQALAKSQNPAEHRNWSQELRYAGELSSSLSGVIGIVLYRPGSKDQWYRRIRFCAMAFFTKLNQQSLENSGTYLKDMEFIQKLPSNPQSAAAFTNVDWEVVKGLHVLPGLRLNYDKKDVVYDRTAARWPSDTLILHCLL